MNKISSKKLRDLRSELGLNADQFADLLDVSVRTVQRWEKEDHISIGRTAGTKNLEHLIEVMENEISNEELKTVLKKFQGTGKDISIPLISSVLDTMSLITGSAQMGVIYGKEIIKMLERVVEKASNHIDSEN